MAGTLIEYKIFLASPKGLEMERQELITVINDYNKSDAMNRGVVFNPIEWKEVLGGVGRPQALINEHLEKCDYFILMLWNRWGDSTEPPSDSNPKYSSGTEEEFHLAEECFRDRNKPMTKIVIMFKTIDRQQMSDPGPQLAKVIAFKKNLDEQKLYLSESFDDLKALKHRIRCHLAQWLQFHEKGSSLIATKQEDESSDETCEANVQKDSCSNPQIDIKNLPNEAEILAKQGKITEAEQKFAELVSKGDDPTAFIRYGKFLYRNARYADAEKVYKSILELDLFDGMPKIRASAFGELGLIYFIRGELGLSREMQMKAIGIYEKLNNRKGLAVAYTRLGLINKSYGDLEAAEKMHSRALTISETLDSNSAAEEGKAIALSNLGDIFMLRSNFNEAETMYFKALEVNRKIGRDECVAKDYGNLGVVYQNMNKLKLSEEMLNKALKINYKLSRKKNIADNYNQLGLLYLNTGDVEKAIGFLNKAIEINERLGRLEGLAENNKNLGIIAKKRGQVYIALDFLEKSRSLYIELDSLQMVKKVQSEIDSI